MKLYISWVKARLLQWCAWDFGGLQGGFQGHCHALLFKLFFACLLALFPFLPQLFRVSREKIPHTGFLSEVLTGASDVSCGLNTIETSLL